MRTTIDIPDPTYRKLKSKAAVEGSSVMEDDVLGQRAAWRAYRRWYDDERVEFLREPESPAFESVFEKLSESIRPSTKLWADAYLAAFAKTAGLTLVTFDQGFQRMKLV